MLRFSRGSAIAILAIVAYGIILAWPNVWSEETRKWVKDKLPAWVPSAIVPHKAMPLGLDLKGGVYLMLQVDRNDVIRGLVGTLRDDIRRILREERVVAPAGIGVTPRGAQLRIPDAAQRAKVMPRIRQLSTPIGNALIGSSLGNSLEVDESADGLIRLTLTDPAIIDKTRRSVEQSIEVIRRRIDPQGVRELSIQRQGAERIEVQIPGVDKADDDIGKPAKLEFKFVGEVGSAEVDMLESVDDGGRIPVERSVIVDGGDLTDAQPGFEQQGGRPNVNFSFNIKGAQRFGKATAENVGRRLAIVLDGQVISAPVIQSPILGGRGQITGSFTVEQTTKLSVLLRSGALPAKLTIIEQRTVGAGLGSDQIRAGQIATYIGAAMVAIFMVLAYGVFGLIATVAVVVNVVLVIALLSAVGATLTLPGIAGILLTIGMAVDSNVLIYERVREEQRMGRSTVGSLDAGFVRALGTIIDANLTTLMAGIALYLFGTGPVKGFAVTLSIGIATTVFTAYTLTRLMVSTYYDVFRPKQIAM
jgi:preprotein translocase subunit SecD